MKKVLMVAAMLFAGLFTYCYGQDVRVNINNQDYTSQDCEYKINGICSSEDIGGVEIKGVTKWEYAERPGGNYYYDDRYAVLTNYNPFTVTVLYEDYYIGNVNSVVLRANETKEVFYQFGSRADREPKSSTSFNFPLKGMIVRKLGQ